MRKSEQQGHISWNDMAGWQENKMKFTCRKLKKQKGGIWLKIFRKSRENQSPEQGRAPCQIRTIAYVFVFLASIPHSQPLAILPCQVLDFLFIFSFHSNLCAITGIISEVKDKPQLKCNISTYLTVNDKYLEYIKTLKINKKITKYSTPIHQQII